MKRALLAAAVATAIVTGVAAASGGPSLLNPPSLHAKAPRTFTAKFVTTKGVFVVKVTRSWSPKGADRFYNLVRNHYYDKQPIFRVLPGREAQWGISGTPAIAKAWQYAYIKDDPVTHQNLRGTLTYANAGKNSRTTQVFVNLGSSNLFLDKRAGFSPLGVVTKGLYSVFHNLYSRYGETPEQNQAKMIANGAAWVRRNFPKLDWIKTARIVRSR
jgi:peptidyl-prolyl cis-trans isomerase A (cyclophilin A)